MDGQKIAIWHTICFRNFGRISPKKPFKLGESSCWVKHLRLHETLAWYLVNNSFLKGRVAIKHFLADTVGGNYILNKQTMPLI